MIQIQNVIELQRQRVADWHREPTVGLGQETGDILLDTICQQHRFNYLLWHEEDIARSPDVSDTEIARVKRSIDGYNQQRNDWIEKVDDVITQMADDSKVVPASDAMMNTETPGSTIDRLSILALRIYHLREQLDRADVDQSHRESVEKKIAVCLLQLDELSTALQQLVDAIFAGQKRHRTYRQFKMYNDPTLNPYLYRSREKTAQP